MKIKDIYIRDFGIFNNQKLNNLADNIIIIGGKNRAGKSTFLDILKYLPFSLPKDKSIPPAKNKYYLEAAAEKDGQNYRIILNGFADSEAIDNSGNYIAPAELYNNLDQITYQQLFTISLDELQKISKIGSNKKEEQRIYSILLGAGLSELIKLPEIAENYYSQAKNIGGSLGNPAVASFKPLNNDIKKAENKRDEALKEIDYFIEKKKRLKSKKENLNKLKKEINQLEEKEFLFDLLKNNYQKLNKIDSLKFEIKKEEKETKTDYKLKDFDQIEKYYQEFTVKKEEFEKQKELLLTEIKADKFDDFLNLISANKDLILEFNNQKEILKEKIKNLKREKLEQNKALRDLKIELEDLNISWDKPLKYLDEIKIDLIKQQQLIMGIKEYQELSREIELLEEKIEDLYLEVKTKEDNISDYKSLLANSHSKKGALLIFFSALLSSYFLYSNLYSFSIISISFLIAFFIYYFFNYRNLKLNQQNILKLEQGIKKLQDKIDFQKKLIEQKKLSLTKNENLLKKYAEILTIENKDYLKILAEYYREIKEKKRRYKKIKFKEEEFKNEENKLISKLNNISLLIKNLGPFIKGKFLFKDDAGKNLLENRAEIFKDFDRIYTDYLKIDKYLELKDKFENLKSEIKNNLNLTRKNNDLKKELEKAIQELQEIKKLNDLKEELKSENMQLNYTLKSSDKIREYLTAFNENNENNTKQKIDDFDLKDNFISLYNNFSSKKSLVKKYQKTESELENKIKEQELLKEKITTLNNSITRLSTSEKIEEAQKEISESQNDLEKLAQKYAVNKSVYFILNKLRSRMIKKAENELLKPAAEIFSEITNNEYQKIEPSDKLENIEFKTITNTGKTFKTVNALSRATLEQLFLSLRFSRIKEIKPALPIIIDDSFVNFDYQHLHNTLETITDLAQDNQVFILSCHSHLIKIISKITDSAQYWKLDKGNFELSTPKKLAAHLKT